MRCVHCSRPKDQHNPDTLLCHNGRTVFGTMDLPAGTTCHNCIHFRRCSWLISATVDRKSCDWWPPRFVRVQGSAVSA